MMVRKYTPQQKIRLLRAGGFPDSLPQLIIAEAFRVTAPAVVAWVKYGCPQAEDKTYDLRDVIAWRIELLMKAFDSEDDQGDEHKRRWLKARADRVEIEVQQLRGEMVPASEVRTAWGTLIEQFRIQMLAMPNAVAPDLVGKTASEIAAELDRRTRAAFELLQECPGLAAEEETEESEE